MPGDVRGKMESAFGVDLSPVRIHEGPHAEAVGALAYTQGTDIHFAPGQYQPESQRGQELLGHELTHVVQQSRGRVQATVQAKGVDINDDPSLEREADELGARAARGHDSRASSQEQIETSARGSVTQQAIQRTPAPAPSDPLLARLHARLHASPRDLAGYWSEVVAAGTSRAGDAVVRAGLRTFVNDGKLSWAEACRTVCNLELGPEASWPLPVKNFAQGADRGTFSVTALPPAGADALREFCVNRAGVAAEGAGDVKANYRNAFNARWDSSRFAGFTSAFDASLDSKGPRNQRARQIFAELYADPVYRTAYDTNTPAGFRALADTHAGPDGINLIASARLQELRATLAPPVVTAASTADAAYTALIGVVRPKAEALDARDRQEIDRSHQWRLAVDGKVNGTTPGATTALRADLWSVITTSRPAVPAPGPGPGPAPAPVPVTPPPTPNAAQTAWLGGITLTAPASPVHASVAEQPLTFQVRSAVPNPGLAVRRRVVVEPAAQVASGQEDESDWANAAAAADHTAEINPEPATGAPHTTFTARLTMPPLTTATFPEKAATVNVEDKRLDWFRTNIRSGLAYTDENQPASIAPSAAIHYFGGQCPLRVQPVLAGGPNPGLAIEMDGQLTKGGVVTHTFPRTRFPSRAERAALFDTILREPTPAPAVPEAMQVTIRFFQSVGAAAMHTITVPFTLAASPAPVAGGDAAVIAADNAWLNTPIATAGGLLHFMNAQGGTAARVANAVATGVLKVRACMIRSDSAAAVTAAGKNPAEKVAYAMGVVDPLGTTTNTLVAVPGAAGWRWPAHPDTVFLNATPATGGAHRSLASLSEFLTHEGIHAADRVVGLWGRYATEFRAYWIMGTGAGASTAFDPTMSGLGPKSPRARRIFNHLYGSPTYSFVKPAYDENTNGFREQVDNYLCPDGINLTLSPRLADLRREVEGYSGAAASYAAKRAAIVARLAAIPAADPDRAEIRNNREWRDLVESKFPTRAVVGAAPPTTERNDIKSLLGIPR